MQIAADLLVSVLCLLGVVYTRRNGLVYVPLTLGFLGIACGIDILFRITHLDHVFYAAFGA